MTQETYENLMRVIEKRKRQAKVTGNRAALRDACEDEARLYTRFKEEQP